MNGSRDDWKPTASWATLECRARMLAVLRRVFDENGYIEVETPLLSMDVCIDEHLEPFVVGEPGGVERFLQTSPEFAMKRLLAAGADSIYQVTRAFRRDELGQRHNPEFTMVEWYRRDSSYHDQMDFTETLIRAVALAVDPVPAWSDETPFRRLSYDEAFQRALGVEVLARPTSELVALARRELDSIPDGLTEQDRDGWLNLLLAGRVEPTLGRSGPEFLFDYPASQAALARVRCGTIDVAERMELYIDGLEICNGYQELTDAEELADRMRKQLQRRLAAGGRRLPVGSRLESAQRAGFPECAGVALGLDRLVMSVLGLPCIQDVLAFPFPRA